MQNGDIVNGTIVFWEAERGGIIDPGQGTTLLFNADDVIIGTPRVGEAVQFVFEGGADWGRATKVVILSDAARSAMQKSAY